MDKGLAVAVAAVVGGLVGMQAPANAILGRAVGSLPAEAFSLVVSTLLLVALLALTGEGTGDLGRIRGLPWYAVIGGGLIGAAYVASSLVTVQALGAGSLTALTIAGQLTIAVVIDHFGLLHLTRAPVTATKLLGVALLAAGTYLIIRD
jgi:bacterial/archaeal transporter family-2 protein